MRDLAMICDMIMPGNESITRQPSDIDTIRSHIIYARLPSSSTSTLVMHTHTHEYRYVSYVSYTDVHVVDGRCVMARYAMLVDGMSPAVHMHARVMLMLYGMSSVM